NLNLPAASPTPRRLVVVVVDGASLGIMSFAFGVFDAAVYYGALPELDVRIVSGEPDAAIRGGGLVCNVPYDLSAIREADLVIVPYWRDPAQPPPAPVLEVLGGVLAQMYPKVSVRASVLYIDDGDILTAGGGAAGMDLGLHLIRASHGAVVANRLARNIVVAPHRPGGQSQYIESPVPEPDQDDPVGETMSWALGQLDQA